MTISLSGCFFDEDCTSGFCSESGNCLDTTKSLCPDLTSTSDNIQMTKEPDQIDLQCPEDHVLGNVGVEDHDLTEIRLKCDYKNGNHFWVAEEDGKVRVDNPICVKKKCQCLEDQM